MDDLSFQEFRKIPRLYREVIITEKIDGTNAHFVVPSDNSPILVGSRTRYITPGKATDNYGFANFVQANNEKFRKLGPGRYYGEWWGVGINRGYDLTERRFSFFNPPEGWDQLGLPSNVTRVPILHVGAFRTEIVDMLIDDLVAKGSRAAPGYMNPEGVVIFHKASGAMFKVTQPSDGHKGET